MSIAVFIALIVAAVGCGALLFTMPGSPDTAGWAGVIAWLVGIALPLLAECYLLTLAVGMVQP